VPPARRITIDLPSPEHPVTLFPASAWANSSSPTLSKNHLWVALPLVARAMVLLVSASRIWRPIVTTSGSSSLQTHSRLPSSRRPGQTGHGIPVASPIRGVHVMRQPSVSFVRATNSGLPFTSTAA